MINNQVIVENSARNSSDGADLLFGLGVPIPPAVCLFAIAGAKIITTANYSEIEQVKDQLTIILTNSYPSSSYRETSGRYLPEPSSGVIEYLAFIKYYSSSLDADYDMTMDYVDGEYHNFYKILLTT